MNYHVKFPDTANKQIDCHLMAGRKDLYNKILTMARQLVIDLYNGIGTPEKIKCQKTNLWSRRIDKKHRLIYNVKENKKILIASV